MAGAGAVEGVVVGPVGELLSCRACEQASQAATLSQERADRKDESERLDLETSRRQASKDTSDLGAKIAGVALAAGALAWSIFGKKDQQKPESDPKPAPRDEDEDPKHTILTRAEVEILMVLWEDLQQKTAARQDLDAGLSTSELYARTSPDRDQARRHLLNHRLRDLARHTDLVIEKARPQRDGHGPRARIYSLNAETAITRPATALIVEFILSADAQNFPERDLVKRIYESNSCGGAIKDAAQISEEIGFAIAAQYVERVEEEGSARLHATWRAYPEHRYLNALASKCRQAQVRK